MEGIAYATINRAFVRKSLERGERRDQRGMDEERGVEFVSFREGTLYRKTIGGGRDQGKKVEEIYGGSGVECASGIVVYVQKELREPSPETPTQGHFSVSVNPFPQDPYVSQYVRGISGDRFLSRVAERAFKESDAVDIDSLCVIPHKLAWSIKVDVFVVGNDGGLTDLIFYGISHSLANTEIPIYKQMFEKGGVPGEEAVSAVEGFSGENRVLVDLDDVFGYESLSLNHLPLSVTIGVFGERDQLTHAVDPSHEEETVEVSRVIVVLNTKKQATCIMSLGQEIPVGEYGSLVSLGVSKAQEKISAAAREWIPSRK
jgi:exosome complex RNA-binding protein Rrp42 (RNase PH superfamily)